MKKPIKKLLTILGSTSISDNCKMTTLQSLKVFSYKL